MKHISLLIFTVLLRILSFGQNHNGKISLVITNNQDAPLSYATVELLRAQDSVLVKSALTDNNGVAEFDHLGFQSYIIRTSMVGWTTRYTSSFALNETENVLHLPALQLSASSNQLQAVTVTGRKPFIQKLSDRIVVNVENSIVNAGSSAFDVLDRSPGVNIDQNDVISLRGKAGVIIMIDGKPSPLNGADLANYLRGLPSNAIERIDIITNPSSKYDAAGNAGIIDIRMKKDQGLGTNGSMTAGYGQGFYPKANAGGSFNYRNKSVNIFGNYNYTYRKLLNHLFINRNFYDDGSFTGSDDKDNLMRMPLNSHTARLGADFFPSKNTIIGFVVNSNFNHFQRHSDITTIVNDIQNQPNFSFVSLGTNNDHTNNTVANINFKKTYDSSGRELSADVDYGVFNTASLSSTSSSYYNLNGTRKKEDDVLDGDQNGKLILRTGKADYTHPLKKGVKLDMGFKTSYVSSDNDAKFYNRYPSGSTVDTTKTNHFDYQEYNNAAYLNFSKENKKFNYQLGLRGEQTNINTHQVKGDSRYSTSYFRLFPSAFFNYKIRDEQTLGLSVSRRIDRPGYSQLDPFLFQIDPTIYATGNPFLKPQMTWSYEMSYTVKSMNFSLAYSRTADPQNVVLSRILDVIPNFQIPAGQDSNITVQIPVNLGSSDYAGLTAALPIRVRKWWNMTNNINIYYQHFNGDLGGTQLNNGSPAADVRTNNNFNFKKGWAAELNGNLNTGGRYGYMVLKAQWGISVGGQKTMFKGKGSLRLNVTDIFWTNLPKAKVVYEGRYVENWHAQRDSRVANLTFTYRFGNSKVQQARHRSTASEEERQRAGGS
ncbi:MAG: outer membrane beta-barrel protein [Flavisolibacter sp.]